MFYFQLFLIGAFDYFTGRIQMDVPSLVGWCIMGGVWIFFNLAVLYWLSCILIVFPASFVFRVFPIPTSVAVGVGGAIGGLICWMQLEFNMLWVPCFACLSSSIITGSVTGFMLCLTSRDMAPPAKRSVWQISRN